LQKVFGTEKVTTGASGDFQGATSIASQMVKAYGMSDKLGPRIFNDDEQMSPQTRELIDQEIKKTLNESYERAKNLLKAHSHELKLLAEALLVHETLDRDQVKRLLENQKI
jgi:ATP-dependent metalloprotease